MPPHTHRIPLLRDWHTHPLLYAAFRDGVDLNQNPSETRDAALDRIRTAARSGRGGWVIAHGWNSGRYSLTKADFDDLPPVVVFNLSLHGLIVNDAGRDLMRQSDSAVAENLDDQDWIERHLRQMLNVFAVAGATVERVSGYFRWLLEEHGVYRVDEMLLVGAEEIRLMEECGLSQRVRFWAAPELYEELPPPVREMVHGVKLFADGAIGATTAALHRPYRTTGDTGMLLYQTDELQALFTRYLKGGVPMAVHAIGDRAIDQVVGAVEAVGKPPCEFRLEHAQLISEPTARRAKALGIRLCMQPNFSDDSTCYADRMPAGAPERNNPFRMLIDRVGYTPGDDLIFGSDGMPHGVREGLRQSLFPQTAGQVLTLAEFVAGYCLSDESAGHIEVRIDQDKRQVDCRIVVPDGPEVSGRSDESADGRTLGRATAY